MMSPRHGNQPHILEFNLIALAIKPLALSLLQPPLVFMGLAAWGGFQLQQGRARRGWSLFVLALLGIWFSGCESMGRLLGQHWLSTPPAISRADIERLQALHAKEGGVAVLVLGGGARQWAPEYQDSTLNEFSMPRLRLGIWLSRQIQAPLAFSGGVGWQARDQISTEGQIAGRIAADEFQHPLSWVEDRSRDTRENARYSLELLRQHKVRTLVLVTHEQHMPRSIRAFQEAMTESGVQTGISLIPAPAGLRPDGEWRLSNWLPSSDGYLRVRYVVYEAMALAAGH